MAVQPALCVAHRSVLPRSDRRQIRTESSQLIAIVAEGTSRTYVNCRLKLQFTANPLPADGTPISDFSLARQTGMSWVWPDAWGDFSRHVNSSP